MKRYNSLNWFQIAVLIIASYTTCTAVLQAPGDEEQECTQQTFTNQETLLDSNNYTDILNGTWTVVDNYNNNDPMGGHSIPTVQ